MTTWHVYSGAVVRRRRCTSQWRHCRDDRYGSTCSADKRPPALHPAGIASNYQQLSTYGFLCLSALSEIGFFLNHRRHHHNHYYPRRLCRLAWVGFSSPSVCLSVCLFVCGINELSPSIQTWYILHVVWFWVERSKVNVKVTVVVNSNMAWVRTLWVPSSY